MSFSPSSTASACRRSSCWRVSSPRCWWKNAGSRGAYKDRARRVLAPLAAGIVTILPVTGLLLIDFWLSARFGTHDLIPDLKDLTTLGQEMVAKAPPGTAQPDQPTLGHLWFLYYLCYFYLLIPVCRFLVRQSLKIEDRLKRWLASPFLLPVFALYTSATLWPYHGGQVHEGFIFFKPHLPSLVYYGSFFVFGYLFHAYRDFLQALARNVSLWAVLAAILFPLAMYASQLDNDVRRDQHRAAPGRRDRKRTVHLGADLLFPRPRAAFLRPGIALDPVCVAVVVLGLPRAHAARLPGRVVAGAVRSSGGAQVSAGLRLHRRPGFSQLPLLGAENLARRIPARAPAGSGLAVAGACTGRKAGRPSAQRSSRLLPFIRPR